MSRADQFEDAIKDPSVLTINWAGGNDAGHLKAYDKATKEKVPKLEPLSFVVLKERNCIDGFLAMKGCGAGSNEVANLATEPLTVNYWVDGKPQMLTSGLYKDIKGDMESKGLKYHKVIYGMVVDSPDIATGVIVKFMFKGAGATAWFELSSQDKKGVVALTGSEDGQTGAVRYKIPSFGPLPITEEADKLAEEAYEKVDAFLKSRATEAVVIADDTPDEVDEDSLPF